MYRRLFSLALVSAALMHAVPGSAQEGYPDRPIRLVVPQSAGSGADVVARLLGQKLGQELHQSIVVDNRPGANGIIGASFVAKQPSDGYSLMLAGVSQISFNQHLYASLPYNAQKDFTFVAPVVDTPFVLVVSKASGITSVQSFIEKAKQKTGGLTYGSAGVGNSTHLAMEMIGDKLGIKMTHVAYKGSGPALTGVIGGEVDAMVSVLGAALPQITGGNVVPLAIVGQKRAKELPNVPTIKEAGVDTPVMPGWYALVGPAGMDPKVVAKLNSAVQAFLADPQVKVKLASLYLDPIAGSADTIKQRALTDSRVWGDFIRKRGIRNS
ncbi:tripartite tricarboxylate transporter substrate binding protein [Cupriavidus necator]|uniref:Bug family tripartite tricarboxylate transporter substrate binding protein n=1 Tax=Cupriavidus necator TaxID=106590 RepID=UPI00339D6532